ncbi:NlpC/P60 family protein [Streptomyces chrestomyceticus]|uniref:C40 family peptidase n=1 Tax=Streptomyces chrestomyceticus TaxID=68185 RepID=UPI0033F963B6
MSAKKGAVVAGVAVVVVPVALLFSVGGKEEEVPTAGAAGLDAKQIPGEYLTWVQKAGKICPLITGPVIAAQIEAESGWNPKAASPVGAQGISQFMPSTWKSVGVDAASKNGDPRPDGIADPFTPGDAIMTQGKYDCDLAKGIQKRLKAGTIKGDPLSLTLAAYNAGTGAVERYGGIPPYVETQGYVKKILALASKYTLATDDGGATGFAGRVISEATRWKGVPYSWGGGTVEGPGYGFGKGAGVRGFDCSSLVQFAVYHASGGKIMLPRTSQMQATKGKEISPSGMKPGDVIAYALNGAGNYDHIGIYMGAGKMVHAPKPGDVVKISDINNGYYQSKPKTIRRFG